MFSTYSYAKCSRNIILALTLGSMGSATALAADTAKEVRPSYLLNVETAGTQADDTLVLSMFGTNGRASMGLGSNAEARVDFGWTTLVDTGTTYNTAVTGKYHVGGNEMFGLGVLGAVAQSRQVIGAPTTTLSARLPITAKFNPVLVTVVPLISKSTISGDDARFGADFGVAVPLFAAADLIGEYTITTKNSVSESGYVAGIAFKPANRITIPLVLAKKVGDDKSFGVLGFLAHVGFEF